MIAFFASHGIWDWFIAGGVLLVLEVLAHGVFMLWLGLAAILVGMLSLVIDWPWQAQFVAFAVFSLAAIPLWRRFARMWVAEAQRLRDLEGQYSAMGAVVPGSSAQMGMQRKVLRSLDTTGAGSATRY